MPFESSLPLVVTCLLGATGVVCVWLRVPSRGLLAGAAVLGITGVGAFVADCLVETDREHLRALFPRLAHAAERRDIDTVMAALDPDLHPLRAEAETLLKHVQPTEVAITRIDLTIDPTSTPPKAVANLIVRVTGTIIDQNTPGTVLMGVKVLLHKKHGRWLVEDVEGEPFRPGQREHLPEESHSH